MPALFVLCDIRSFDCPRVGNGQSALPMAIFDMSEEDEEQLIFIKQTIILQRRVHQGVFKAEAEVVVNGGEIE
ncbi:hypothetical protein Tco_0269461, partial [Tanacetum coccineum]